MNTIQIKKHFVQSEFLKSKTIPEGHELTEKDADVILWWSVKLSIIRQMLDFPISVTDGLRLFNGGKSRSQHFYNESWSIKGAVDIRPTDRTNSNQFLMLGLALAAHPEIKRVCYYAPSERFPNGGCRS